MGRYFQIGFLFVSFTASASVLRVCKTCEIKSIQQAVALAPNHGTIQVEAGEYLENNIAMTRPVKLIATPSAKVIIDGQKEGNVIYIQGTQIEVSGFHIRNSGMSHTNDFAGIKVMNSSSCSIRNNTLENNFFGIYLGRSNKCTVENNHVEGQDKGEAETGNGIHVWYGQHMNLINNTTNKNRDGIYFEFVTDSSISHNNSFQNHRYGLHFMFSHNNSYFDNTFEQNGSGVAVMYSRHISMIKNRFISSLGPAAYGLLLKDISDSMISENIFKNNTLGVFIEGTTRTTLQKNEFISNGWAVKISGDAESNQFIYNDFIDNTFDVSSHSALALNTFSENFWSHYKGLDFDHDGFGDFPYYPVQLSSMLIDKYKVSAILTNSFFFQLLDEVDRVLPVLTPANLKDSKPRMLRGPTI